MKVNKYVGFVILTPSVSFGGLGDKAAEVAKKTNTKEEVKKLSNTVMKEIDKKIAAVVGDKPISETDKANIIKKLSDMAESIVTKLINGVGFGKLPESAEIVNTVMKELLPQIDDLVDAIIEAERDQSAAAAPLPSPSHVQSVVESQPHSLVESHDQFIFESPTQDQPIFQPQAPPLFESPPQTQPAQPLLKPSSPARSSAPRIGKQRVAAVYVTGGSDVGVEIKESVGAGILNAIANDKKHISIESGKEFSAEVDALRSEQTDNAVYDSQISEIGAKFDISFVCAVEITTTSEAFHILARMIDVQTAEAVSVGNAFSPLKSEDDIAVVSGELVRKMAVEWGVPPPLPPLLPPPLPPVKGAAPTPHQPFVWPPTQDDEDKRASMTGFSLGYGISQDAESNSGFLQFGFVHSRPIFKNVVSVSVNVEGNLWVGIIGEYRYRYYDGSAYDYADKSFDFFGANVPATILFQWKVFFLETGLFGDALFCDNEIFYNAGIAAGAGIVFDKKRARRYFYRYNSGYNYGAHVVGVRWLF
jgi:hypothetical protein